MPEHYLRCPLCGSTFSTVTITDSAVACPECGATMFAFRRADDSLVMTRGRLFALVDGNRRTFVEAVGGWLAPERKTAAPVLLGYLISHIADTLPE